MAKMQKEDKEVVAGVIQDITDFSEAITGVMGDLKSTVSNMNDIWNDAQYTIFQNYIDELDTNVARDLEELENARAQLAYKLSLYD